MGWGRAGRPRTGAVLRGAVQQGADGGRWAGSGSLTTQNRNSGAGKEEEGVPKMAGGLPGMGWICLAAVEEKAWPGRARWHQVDLDFNGA